MALTTEFLAQTPFFCAFTEDQLAEIILLLKQKRFPAGATLFLSGEPGDALYLVRRGRVELFVRDTAGNKVTLTFAGEGEIFGELALLDQGPRSASAVTAEECELYCLEHDAFEKLLENQPKLLHTLLGVLGQRLRQADSLLSSHRVANVNEAIQKELNFLQRCASTIADFTGTLLFLFINIAIFTFWIAWNLGVIPGMVVFDPFPFSLLSLAVSLEAILLSILVLLSQNIQSSKDRIRDDIEYEVNLNAELEIHHLHTKVDLMHAEILSRLHRLDKHLVKKN